MPKVHVDLFFQCQHRRQTMALLSIDMQTTKTNSSFITHSSNIAINLVLDMPRSHCAFGTECSLQLQSRQSRPSCSPYPTVWLRLSTHKHAYIYQLPPLRRIPTNKSKLKTMYPCFTTAIWFLYNPAFKHRRHFSLRHTPCSLHCATGMPSSTTIDTMATALSPFSRP